MKKLVRTVAVSLWFMLAASVLAIFYGFVTRRAFSLAYVFPANFAAGAVIICVAITMLILPAGFKFDKLTDHSTFVERYYDERQKRRGKAFGYLFLGLSIIAIAGVAQLVLAWVVPAG